MRSDSDRSAVSAAEVGAFEGTDLEVVVGIAALRRVIDMVVADEWWPGPQVSVIAARSGARSSSARCSGSSTQIRIAAPQATIATAAHELAHALAGVGCGHDGTFRRAHLDVIGVLTNFDRVDGRGDRHVRQLNEAYIAAGLEIRERSWTAPPEPDRPIVL